MKTTWLATMALMMAPALAVQAPPSPPLDPVGNYQVEITVPDLGAIGARLMIKGSQGAWEGTMTSDLAPETPIRNIVVDGQVLRFTVTAPDGATVPVRLTFKGDEFTGSVSLGGMEIPVTGKRIRTP